MRPAEQVPTSVNPQSPTTAAPRAESVSPSTSTSPSITQPGSSGVSPNDIGYAFQLRNDNALSDSDLKRFALECWKPSPDFKYPFSERRDGQRRKKMYLGPQHLTDDPHNKEKRFSCFEYSQLLGGILCRHCVLFGGPSRTAGGVPLGRLVTQPLTNYSRLTGREGYLTKHLKKDFQDQAKQAADAFLKRGEKDILTQIDAKFAQQRDKNRAALTRIISAIEYHGRLGLPLRGHSDSGPLRMQNDIDYTQGNFCALMQMMAACGDKTLEEHSKKCAKNASYISPAAQNNIIGCINTVLQQHIVEEVVEAKMFSLLADETSDASHTEQLTVCVRYVSPQGKLFERFLGFLEAPDVTAEGLSTQLLKYIRQIGLDPACMVGQGYDGAAAMSGHLSGVQKRIRDQFPSAAYVHCVSHSLNLCLQNASDVPQIRAAITVMHQIAVFFSDSQKRIANLRANIAQHCPESARNRLQKHCDTRWVEKQTAVVTFRELLPAVTESLGEIQLWAGDKAAGKAALFLNSLNDSSFPVALMVLIKVLQVTKPLSVQLQAVSQDLSRAMASVNDCIDLLTTYRNDEADFALLFSAAGEIHQGEIKMPRIAARQTQRVNVPANTPQEYYRRAVYLPFIDTCIGQLTERFTEHHAKVQLLCSLLPSLCVGRAYSSLQEAVTIYAHLLPGSVSDVEPEYLRWQLKWSRVAAEERPATVLETLSLHDDLATYPALHVLLRVFATLPVTTATGERSFSALKYVKSTLRSTMSEDRLNGLTMLFVHKDIKLNVNAVIDAFAKDNRRCDFR